jgi:hypothetical protein
MYLMGEPLLDPYVEDRMLMADEVLRPQAIHVSTNAVLASEHRARSLVMALEACANPQLWITVFGLNDAELATNMGVPSGTLAKGQALARLAVRAEIPVRIHAMGTREAHKALWPSQAHVDIIRPDQLQTRAGNVPGMKPRKKRGADWRTCKRLREWLLVDVDGFPRLCCNDYGREVKTPFVWETGAEGARKALREACERQEQDPDWICSRCDE